MTSLQPMLLISWLVRARNCSEDVPHRNRDHQSQLLRPVAKGHLQATLISIGAVFNACFYRTALIADPFVLAGWRQGSSTTLMHLSFLSRNVRYAVGASSKPSRCVITNDGSISPCSMRRSKGRR